MKRMFIISWVCLCFNFRLFSNIQSIAFILIHLHAHLWMEWRRRRAWVMESHGDKAWPLPYHHIHYTRNAIDDDVLKHEHSDCIYGSSALPNEVFYSYLCAHFFSFSFDFDGASNHIVGNNEQFKFIDSPLKLCFIAQLDVHMVWFTRPRPTWTNMKRACLFSLHIFLPCEKFFCWTKNAIE